MLPHHRHDGFSVRNFTNLNFYYKLGYRIEYIFITKNSDPDFSKQKRIFPEVKFLKINPETSELKDTLIGKLVYWLGFPCSILLDLSFNYRIPLKKFVKNKSIQYPDSIFHFEAIDTAVCLYGSNLLNAIWSNHDYVSERYKKRQKISKTQFNSFRKMIENYVHYSRLKKIENLVAKSSSLIITVSETEAKKYKSRWPKSDIHLFPISWHDEKIIKKDGFLTNAKINLIHIGRVDGFLGYQSLKYIFEKVFPLLPDTYLNKINFNIVGLDNNSAKSTEIKALAMKYKNVQFLGFVDDIKAFYSSSDLHLVASKYATGARTRIIESLVYGVPVLSTPESADGLVGLSNEDNILIAQSDKEFSSAIKSVIDNPKILEDIRINGRATYEKYYSLSCRNTKR